MIERLEKINRRIAEAAESAGRAPEAVQLVSVSKTIPAERVRQAIEAGVQILGENYVQEARSKFDALGALPVSWHFIGHLQSNKAKYAVRIFDLIHSLDSIKLANALNRSAEKINKVQSVLIQVNVAGEKTKSGVATQDAEALVRHAAQLKHLKLEGLMTMPPYFNDPDRVRPFFRQLCQLRDKLQTTCNVDLPHLSMGMSGDFEAAIAEGATLVRVGTAIFGARG